ncbi:MAG: hypothetical protein RIS24_3122 [Verrucomicrobiota bacterium]
MIASRAGFGPIPLRCGVVDIDPEGGDSLLCVVGWHGLRGMGPAPDRKLGGGSAFALCARGECDRFQRGLRPHPATLAYLLLRTGPAPDGQLGGGSPASLLVGVKVLAVDHLEFEGAPKALHSAEMR